jgi:Leucine-rich repeat (LRR) protein
MCFDTSATSISVTFNTPARYDWGDGRRDVASVYVSHSYSDGIEHTFCIELLGDWSAPSRLYLDNNALTSLPPELGNLNELRGLDLNFNQLTSLPPELGNLSKLHTLDLRSNQLSGNIPNVLGNLSNLRRLNLKNNQFSGTIPPELGNLSKLITLNLSDNQFSGTIPPELGNLSKLRYLYLRNNQFSQADMSAFVDALYANRATLGSNGCLIDISNNNGLTTTAIDQIEGTGSYAGDGLVQAGCFVTY